MDFKELFLRAKSGEELAFEKLMEMYKPLLVRNSILNGRFDEDLYQELCIVMLKCIRIFRI